MFLVHFFKFFHLWYSLSDHIKFKILVCLLVWSPEAHCCQVINQKLRCAIVSWSLTSPFYCLNSMHHSFKAEPFTREWSIFSLFQFSYSLTIHNFKGFDKIHPKMSFSINLSHCLKSYGHSCQILACFTMITHQVWSIHATQVANFDHISLWPKFVLNSTKSLKISSLCRSFFLQNLSAKSLKKPKKASAFRAKVKQSLI